jgi:uncharacterized protein
MTGPENQSAFPRRPGRHQRPELAALPEAVPPLRHVMVFLVCTFAVTWLAFLPLIVGWVAPESTTGTVWLPLIGIGAPTLTAFVVAAIGSGRQSARGLWRSGLHWRVGIRWYLVVLLLPGLAFAASWLLASGSGGETSQFGPLIPALISGLLAGLLEEFGWSGFAFPGLQARFGFVRAGIAMGFIVAFWHIPLFFTPGQPQSNFAFLPFLITLIPVRILFGWIYNVTGGSVLLTVLLHASGNTWSEILPLGPTAFDTSWPELLVFAIAAVIVVLTYRQPSGPPSVGKPGI